MSITSIPPLPDLVGLPPTAAVPGLLIPPGEINGAHRFCSDVRGRPAGVEFLTGEAQGELSFFNVQKKQYVPGVFGVHHVAGDFPVGLEGKWEGVEGQGMDPAMEGVCVCCPLGDSRFFDDTL